MSKISVLHIIVTDAVAGAEKYLQHLLPALQDRNIVCTLLIICPPTFKEKHPLFVADLEAEGIETHTIETKNTFAFATINNVKRFILENGFHYIHSHLLRTDLLMAIIKKIFLPNLHLINTLHGYRESVLTGYDPTTPIKTGGFFNFINKNVLKQFNSTISISETISQLYLDLGLTKTKFPVIHHGLEIDAKKVLEGYNFKTETSPIIAVVGRLATLKGQIYLVNAMPYILEMFPTCKLYIVGVGPAEESLKNSVNSLSLQSSVKFEGFQSNPYKYIMNADVLVIPSLYEPFGLVFLEGMALKTPIVSFNIPIATELLRQGHSAVLANKGDEKDLAEKIIYLLQHPKQAKTISNNAFEEYKNRYRLADMATNTARFYESLED